MTIHSYGSRGESFIRTRRSGDTYCRRSPDMLLWGSEERRGRRGQGWDESGSLIANHTSKSLVVLLIRQK